MVGAKSQLSDPEFGLASAFSTDTGSEYVYGPKLITGINSFYEPLEAGYTWVGRRRRASGRGRLPSTEPPSEVLAGLSADLRDLLARSSGGDGGEKELAARRAIARRVASAADAQSPAAANEWIDLRPIASHLAIGWNRSAVEFSQAVHSLVLASAAPPLLKLLHPRCQRAAPRPPGGQVGDARKAGGDVGSRARPLNNPGPGRIRRDSAASDLAKATVRLSPEGFAAIGALTAELTLKFADVPVSKLRIAGPHGHCVMLHDIVERHVTKQLGEPAPLGITLYSTCERPGCNNNCSQVGFAGLKEAMGAVKDELMPDSFIELMSSNSPIFRAAVATGSRRSHRRPPAAAPSCARA